MTNTTILAASGLLLFAYLLDIFGRRFRLPGVVLLIVTGLLVRHFMDRAGLHMTWVDPAVPVIGTLGLILIVLEGALDLSVRKDRVRLIKRSGLSALAGFLVSLVAFTAIFVYLLDYERPVAILAAIPFAVISSAVAIPSATGLDAQPREFVIYESAFSDIIGVLVFYAWLNANGSMTSFALELFGGGAVSLVASAVAAAALYYFINQIVGHVRFLPLLAGLVFLYAIGKALELSPLIMILVCGLVINNPDLLAWSKRLGALHTAAYDQTLKEFKGMVVELTFATKSFFFLLLGYWTDVAAMASPEAWLIAGIGLAIILASRYTILRILRQPAAEVLVWIAPRGLITVLLFLAAAETGTLKDFPFGAVMLVVLVSAAMTALAHRGPRQPEVWQAIETAEAKAMAEAKVAVAARQARAGQSGAAGPPA